MLGYFLNRALHPLHLSDRLMVEALSNEESQSVKLPIITSLSAKGSAMLSANCQGVTPAEQGKRLTNRLTKRLTRCRRMSDFLTRRNGTWHFVRRVPLEFASFDARVIVWQSTKVKVQDDRNGRRASQIAVKLNADLEASWHAAALGQTWETTERFETAPDSLIDSLMGHKTYKPKYGKGPSLELKLKFLSAIAFNPPPRVAIRSRARHLKNHPPTSSP